MYLNPFTIAYENDHPANVWTPLPSTSISFSPFILIVILPEGVNLDFTNSNKNTSNKTTNRKTTILLTIVVDVVNNTILLINFCFVIF